MSRSKTNLRKDPISQRQQELLRQEKELQQRHSKLQDFVNQAPKRQEELHRREHEERIQRTYSGSRSGNPFNRIGEKHGSSQKKHRVTLTKERKEQQTQFILLLLVLAFICIILIAITN